MAILLTACTTTIVPPVSPQSPQPVFILDHGRHTTLVLPHPEGIVRYAYGDWVWYAQVQTGPYEATSAVLWPTRAALGRRVLAAPPTERGVWQALKVGVAEIHTVWVDAGAIGTLRRRLANLFRSGQRPAKYNRVYDLFFVEHPVPYTAFHNSNHRVAFWLQQLGCTVRGSAFWAEWQVEPTAQPATER